MLTVLGTIALGCGAPSAAPLSLDDGSLTYDPATGMLAGVIPPLPAGSTRSYGELSVGGSVARSVACDGPPICRAPFASRARIDRLVWIAIDR